MLRNSYSLIEFFQFPSSIRTLDSTLALPARASFTSLKGRHQIAPAVAVQEDSLFKGAVSDTTFFKHQVPVKHLTTRLSPSLPQNAQEDVKFNVFENLQLSRNSLETFKVELHPEEELVRSG